MDLAKSKYVIIALLLAFNIFLLYNNLSYGRDRSVHNETISTALKILESRGFVLDCEIPAKTVSIRRLVYENSKLDKDMVAEKLLGMTNKDVYDSMPDKAASDVAGDDGAVVMENGTRKLVFMSDTSFVFIESRPNSNVNTTDIKKAEAYVRKFLANAGLLDGKYILDATSIDKDGNLILYFIEDFGGFLVFDNYCAATIGDRGIMRLEYSKMRIKGFSPGKINTRAAAYEALLAYYLQGNGQVITSVDIGYKCPEDQSFEGVETSELLPVWRVKMKGCEKPDYLNMIYTDSADGSIGGGAESDEGSA